MRKNDYATEIRIEAVRLVVEARMAVKDVAEKLGVRVGPVYVWVRRYRESRLRAMAFQRLQSWQRDDASECNATVNMAKNILEIRNTPLA